MKVFETKIRPATQYYEFKPCCGTMLTYQDFFQITGTEIYIRSNDYVRRREHNLLPGNYRYTNRVKINFCPFCGEKLEVEPNNE